MKILIDARLYGLENAGLGRYLINLVDQLGKTDLRNEYILLLRKKYFDKLDLPKKWKKVLADFRHYSTTEQMHLPGIIEKENPDISHFPHFNVPVFYSGKYIVTIHDMLMHNFAGLSASTLPAPLYLLKQLAYRFVFWMAVSRSSKIIVPSGTVKTDLMKHYNLNKEKVEVIYEGFDEKILQTGSIDIKKPYFVYAGNAYPHKNLNRLIEAIVTLNSRRKDNVQLAIASARNVFVEKLQKLVQKMQATDFVKILGFVPDNELGGLYKNSAGFVFPSLSEGFGLPGLEAMNCGTPVLASDITVFKEIYGENALYFDPHDISSIVKTMENVLDLSQEERNKRIANAKKFINKYSWVKMAEETLKIYEESCNSIRQGK
jgi:glycosyltransferase involved in cell wall biosynthesis